jgi:hypothetical protein
LCGELSQRQCETLPRSVLSVVRSSGASARRGFDSDEPSTNGNPARPKDSINQQELIAAFSRAIIDARNASQSSRMQHPDPRKPTAKRKLPNE